MRVVNKQLHVDDNTFAQVLRVTVDLDINLETLQDATAQGKEEVAEIYRRIGEDLIESIRRA